MWQSEVEFTLAHTVFGLSESFEKSYTLASNILSVALLLSLAIYTPQLNGSSQPVMLEGPTRKTQFCEHQDERKSMGSSVREPDSSPYWETISRFPQVPQNLRLLNFTTGLSGFFLSFNC